MRILYALLLAAGTAFGVTVTYVQSIDLKVGASGLASNEKDELFVGVSGTRRMAVYTNTGSLIRTWYPLWPGYDSDVDDQGYIYIVETIKGDDDTFWITRYTENGSNPMRVFRDPTAAHNGVACDGTGYIYVTEDYKVTKVTTGGSVVLSWGSRGSGPGQFDRAGGVRVGPDGNVYVVERENNERVQVFTPTGGYLYTFGAGLLNGPRDIALDRLGFVHVTDNDGMEVFTRLGSWVMRYGETETGYGDYIDATAGGYVYVTDPAPSPEHIDVYYVTPSTLEPASFGKVKALFR